MKKIVVFLVSVFVGVFSATAQDIDNFFAKQKENKNVEYVELSSEAIKTLSVVSKMASWLGEFKSDVSKEELEIVDLCSAVLDDVESFEFIASKNNEVNLSEEFKRLKIKKSRKYKLFGRRVDKTQEITVYGEKSKNKSLKNLLVLIADIDDKSTIIANIQGEIRLEKVAKMIELAKEQKKNQK